MPPPAIHAVIWDFGGVISSSPFEAFAAYEQAHGLPPDFLRTVNATNHLDNAWARFERSDITLDAFDAALNEAYDRYVHAREVTVEYLIRIVPDVKKLLTASQRRKLPSQITNFLDTRVLKFLKSSSAGDISPFMFR